MAATDRGDSPIWFKNCTTLFPVRPASTSTEESPDDKKRQFPLLPLDKEQNRIAI
jgi:hypothetical protein